MNTDDPITRLTASFNQSQASLKSFLAALPASAPCPTHPGTDRVRDDHKSWVDRRAVYLPCSLCSKAVHEQQITQRLQRMGIPVNLCNATFENWTPRDDQEDASLAKMREFANAKRGFLVLLGNLGAGKTHLAVAALRGFNSGLFVKQSELLRRLRQTYRDKAAVDPVDEAQNAGCLVLDEMGVSAGGRDEFPMLHDILDYRHGNQKPTILTGNLSWDELCVVVGERMADRLQESAFAVLSFGGVSNRSEARERYFDL